MSENVICERGIAIATLSEQITFAAIKVVFRFLIF